MTIVDGQAMVGTKITEDGGCNQNKGLIFDIQGHSVHDGPGARTTVFFSGCPLHCAWCGNPEGGFHKPLLRHMTIRCTRCGNCREACSAGAVSITTESGPSFDRQLCDTCVSMECTAVCYSEALLVSGRYYSLDELLRIFTRDRHYWGDRGGVTLSGGEPLLQSSFILPLLQRLKESYIHVAVETSAYLSEEYFLKAAQSIDWLFFDLKHMDSQRHRELTGVGNELILSNIRKLARSDWHGFPVARIPVIQGINDDPDNILAMAEFVSDIGFEVINILPFHPLGESKYRQIGRNYAFAGHSPPSEDQLQEIKRLIETTGVVCYIGYKTPF